MASNVAGMKEDGLAAAASEGVEDAKDAHTTAISDAQDGEIGSGKGASADNSASWYEDTFAREIIAKDVAEAGSALNVPVTPQDLRKLETAAAALTKEVSHYMSRLKEFLHYAGDITASHAEAHEHSATQTAAVVEAALSSAEELAYTVMSMKNMLCSLGPMEDRVQSLIFQLATFERLARGIVARAPHAK